MGNTAPITALAAGSAGIPNGFSVSPVETQVTINKGQSKVIDIFVQNPTNTTLIADAVVNDFTAGTSENGVPSIILKKGATLPTNNFISLVQPIQPVSIPTGASVNIPVTISVPQNASAGGYYGVIRFVSGNTPTSSSNTGGTQVGLGASVGSLVLVTVPGNLYEKLSVVQLTTASNGNTGSFFTGGKISLTMRLSNTGNIQSAPYGNILVKSSSGKNVVNEQFNNIASPELILPNSIRKFTINLNYSHWIGHYTVQANIGYGPTGQLIVASTTFWFIPVWLMVVGAVVIIALVALIYRLYTHYIKRDYRRK